MCIRDRIWDTAGQEKYRAATKMFYKGASGALVVFDVTDLRSFELLSERMKEIYEECGEDCAVIIVGNKIDRTEERVVTYETALSFAETMEVPYFEASAKENMNIETIFIKLLTELYCLEEGISTSPGGAGDQRRASLGKKERAPTAQRPLRESIQLKATTDNQGKQKKGCC
eukprot:TRINITY_DN2295_c0_g1_i3.p2 TRINITY_DN2295_c0_g1~~TRINITY_DN2295_c0_g1_i3.p2  ORF type:complete len:172 (-),score=53.50 TRINITY_DN2295_c0_g1_i3:1459-1974(-)